MFLSPYDWDIDNIEDVNTNELKKNYFWKLFEMFSVHWTLFKVKKGKLILSQKAKGGKIH